MHAAGVDVVPAKIFGIAEEVDIVYRYLGHAVRQERDVPSVQEEREYVVEGRVDVFVILLAPEDVFEANLGRGQRSLALELEFDHALLVVVIDRGDK